MNATQLHDVSPIRSSLPELLGLSRQARQLQLRPRAIGARQAGQYVSRLRGRGMEFEESRPYQPGDDVRNMDWRVTARTGRAYSKVFREERERPVLVSVDARASMWFATQGRFKWAQAQRLAALLAWTAVQGGDRIGGEVFSDEQHVELRPRRGRQSLMHLLKVLTEQQPGEDAEMTSMQPVFRRMRHTAHPGSLVVFISDFRGFDQAAQRQLARIARHNDVLLLHVYDDLEARLPPRGFFRLGDGRNILELDAGKKTVRTAYQQDYQLRIAGLQELCLHQHMSWLECSTTDEPFDVLHQIFARRGSR